MDEGHNSINESLQKRARANRLPSLQPVRDLTLGNITKRTFAPNLNAKKIKEPAITKAEVPKEQGESSKRRRGPRVPRERKPPKGREFIQSYSIFAEGPAAASNLGRNEKPVFNLGGPGSKSDRAGPGLRLGGIKSGSSGVKKESDGSFSPVKEKKRIEGFIADIEEGDVVPIVYPRKADATHRLTPSEIFLKEEDNLDYEELGLIQLVNPMPVEGTSVGLDPAKEDTVDFTRLPEGEFAKLQVLDNGEVRLVIGDNNAMVKVINGTKVDHLMELVRIRTLDDEDDQMDDDVSIKRQSGEMHVLGQIQNRFVCTVDFDSVFREMALEEETSENDSDSEFDDR